MTIVPLVAHPVPPHDPALDRVTAVFDPASDLPAQLSGLAQSLPDELS